MNNGNGLVSGVCYNPKDETIICVFDEERRPLNAYGLPGGIIEDGETPREAMCREWSEEVGEAVFECRPALTLPRKGYQHHFFLINNPKNELRITGVPGETGPPQRIPLRDVILKKTKLHYFHLKSLVIILKDTIKEMAMQDQDIAYTIFELADTDRDIARAFITNAK